MCNNCSTWTLQQRLWIFALRQIKIAVSAHSFMADSWFDFDSLNALLLRPFRFKSVRVIILWSSLHQETTSKIISTDTSQSISTNVQLSNDEVRPCHTFSNNKLLLCPLILFTSLWSVHAVYDSPFNTDSILFGFRL